MTKRIFRSVLLCALTVLLAGTMLMMGILYRYFGTRLEKELATSAGYISTGLSTEGKAYLDSLDVSDANRVTWVAADGTVLFDNEESTETMENHADREEIIQALQTGRGTAVRYSATRGCKTMYYAERLPDGTVLRVSTEQVTVWRLLTQAGSQVLVVLPLAVLLALWMASRLSRQIVAPINALDLANPGEADCYDELAPLLEKMQSQNRIITCQMNQLRRKQEEFAAITAHMNEGFVVLDKKANVLSYNAAALRLLGAAAPQGEPSILTLNRSEAVRDASSQALQGNRCERILQKDGLVCQILANPAYDQEKLTGAVLVLLDVTETQQREAMRREFTANVSHELKTPLTSIFGTAEIIENGMVKPEDVAHFAGNIRKEAGRLIALVGDIIRLSRLDEGDIAEQKQPVDLLVLANTVCEQLQPAAQARQVTVSVEGQSCTVNGVPQILEEILFNLCDNAIAYNKPKGSVLVRVEKEKNAGIVSVRDTGIGISPEQQKRVFERFYRVDKSHSGKGTGLGLSIVRHGAAYHGATVELESKEGEGTCITLRFPEVITE